MNNQSSLSLVPKTMISVPRPYVPQTHEVDAVFAMCKIVAHSPLLKSPSKDMQERQADAFYVGQWGLEMGVPFMTSLRMIYIIADTHGNKTIACSAQLLLALMKRAGVKVVIPDPGTITNAVTVTIQRPDSEARAYTYSMAMATKAELTTKSNWKKSPSEMMIWRAVATGARMECPDIVGSLYTVEELNPDIEVDTEGNAVTIPGTAKAYQGALGESTPLLQTGVVTDVPAFAEGMKKLHEQAVSGEVVTPAMVSETLTPSSEPIALPTWLTQANLQLVIGKIMQETGITPANLSVELKSLVNVDNPGVLASWGKYAEGKLAVEAVLNAFKTREQMNKPATPKKADSNGTGHTWTKADIKTLDDACLVWWDIEANAMLSPDEALKRLGQIAWSTYPDPASAIRALTKLAVEGGYPMIVAKGKYQGQYTELSNGQLIARQYGRDDLRNLGPMWKQAVETWKKGEPYPLPEELIVWWEHKDKYQAVKTVRLLASLLIPF